MIFVTETGSSYELDAANYRVRRLNGSSSPTQRQGPDGQWRTYTSISNVELNSSVLICWTDFETQADNTFVAKTTYTSRVVGIAGS